MGSASALAIERGDLRVGGDRVNDGGTSGLLGIASVPDPLLREVNVDDEGLVLDVSVIRHRRRVGIQVDILGGPIRMFPRNHL